ncbi:transposase [Streptomyces sp. NPDC054855]
MRRFRLRSSTPPRARTWGRRGHTPLFTVRGRSRRHISITGLRCYRPGEQPRLIYRPPLPSQPQGRAQELRLDRLPRSPGAPHCKLHAPIVVVVWDNRNIHRAADLRQYEADHDWLAVFQLPSYAPDLNPVGGIWYLPLRAPMAYTALTDPDYLEHTLRRGLAHIQRHPDLITGCLAGSGVTITDIHPNASRKGQQLPQLGHSMSCRPAVRPLLARPFGTRTICSRPQAQRLQTTVPSLVACWEMMVFVWVSMAAG